MRGSILGARKQEKEQKKRWHMTAIPTQYRTDHLFVLVGTNPLPNLVAARLMLKEDGVLHLIYSQDTSKVAERLQRHLSEQYQVRLLPEVEEANAQSIEREVHKELRRLEGSIGLHYTGGTKVMSVHAYRAIEQAVQCEHEPVFSYLDAKTLDLRMDSGWSESVLLEVKPTLKELTTLHGSQFQKNSPQREDRIKLIETASALAQAAPNGGLRAWRAWCDQELREKAHKDGGWKHKRDLRHIKLRLPNDPMLLPVTNTLKAELGLPSDAEHLPLYPDKLRWPFRRKDPRYLCEWLDGEWLEHYILVQVLQVAERCQIHDCAMSLYTDSNISDFDFEFDVAAMRGYQLFGISCTTDARLAKSKLFEAYIRARHLGGDEARIGLISGSEKADKLERQVTQSWDAKGKIKVFGPEHLPNLKCHLADWFQTAS
jgi:hypothetical protein